MVARSELIKRHQVLGQLAGQVEQPLGDEVRADLERAELALDLAHRPHREHESRGLRDQPRVGLDADPQTMIADDPAGERVVGRHRRLGVGERIVRARRPRSPSHDRTRDARARRPPCS